jgi:hypothetical protein
VGDADRGNLIDMDVRALLVGGDQLTVGVYVRAGVLGGADAEVLWELNHRIKLQYSAVACLTFFRTIFEMITLRVYA